MARIWHCPKCSNQIVITVLMEDFPFTCINCGETWCREDMEHFALGLSEFDVAEVDEWLKKRWIEHHADDVTKIKITEREQILLIAIENALNYGRSNGLAPLITIAEMAIRDFGKAAGPQDWCEEQWQQERRQDSREHTYGGPHA